MESSTAANETSHKNLRGELLPIKLFYLSGCLREGKGWPSNPPFGEKDVKLWSQLNIQDTDNISLGMEKSRSKKKKKTRTIIILVILSSPFCPKKMFVGVGRLSSGGLIILISLVFMCVWMTRKCVPHSEKA